MKTYWEVWIEISGSPNIMELLNCGDDLETQMGRDCDSAGTTLFGPPIRGMQWITISKEDGQELLKKVRRFRKPEGIKIEMGLSSHNKEES